MEAKCLLQQGTLKLKAVILLSVLLSSCICNAYKVLVVFPLPGKSHSILGEGCVRRLLDAGHEVTYITGILSEDTSPKLRQIDVSGHLAVTFDDFFDIKRIMKENNKIITSYNKKLAIHCLNVANNTIMDENVQKLMHDPREKFDVVILEWLWSELYVGLASVFNCPFIWFSSREVHDQVLSLIDEDPNPAYVPRAMSSAIPPFTFAQRLKQLWDLLKTKYIKWELSFMEEQIFELAFNSAVAKQGRKLPPLMEAKYNASFVLGNSHVSTGQATRLPPNYASIAGYHIQDTVKPLPDDLLKIMDMAKNGVIYFSMGSMLRGKTMPEKIKTGLLDMFGSLPYTVIWKIEEVPENLPNNVHVVSFAPQQSVLAHPNCILFITHGGQLSITETIHYGVPIIGIPVYGDQFINLNRAVHKGFAKLVTLDYDNPIYLKVAIEDMLRNNSRYHDRVKKLSFIFHDRPMFPGKELVHWVEHVIKTGGAPHLRSPALMLPWYQKTYLDFALAVVVVLCAVKYVFKKLLFKFKSFFNNKAKMTSKKTN